MLSFLDLYDETIMLNYVNNLFEIEISTTESFPFFSLSPNFYSLCFVNCRCLENYTPSLPIFLFILFFYPYFYVDIALYFYVDISGKEGVIIICSKRNARDQNHFWKYFWMMQGILLLISHKWYYSSYINLN